MDFSSNIDLDGLSNSRDEIGVSPWSAAQQNPNSPGISLARADGGKDAWLFLASCFVIEALVWGKQTEYQSPNYILTHKEEAFHFPLVCSKSIIAPTNSS